MNPYVSCSLSRFSSENISKITTPDWVKDAIFYQIFPDRFAKGKLEFMPANLQPWGAAPTLYGFQGGNLAGVLEKLDYLVDLGINAIYFNPIFASTSNHRYHTYDYYQIDPLLGSNKIFRQLLAAAHERGIRVILDGVFNHASRGFFQFNHILECGHESPYVDWFHIKGYPLYAYHSLRKPNYEAWWGLRALPKFNTDNPEVRRFIFDVAQYWIDFGIDGWRLDVPKEIDDDEFWREFRQVVKEANPEAYIVGEIWVDEIHKNGKRWLQGDQFDAIMNYGFRSACINFFIGDQVEESLLHRRPQAPPKPLDAESFARQIETMLGNYPPEIVYAQYNMLESHDTARYLSIAKGDKRFLKLAITFQMTYPGAPAIYYGGEIGLQGGHDPDCRRAMPWNQAQWDTEILDHYKKLITIRKSHPSLRRGDYQALYANAAHEIYAFIRCLDNDKLIIILNNSEERYLVNVPIGDDFSDGAELKCLLSGSSFKVKGKRLRGPALLPRSGIVLSSVFADTLI
jgi:neopullulanase